MAVLINSGPVDAEHSLRDVPRDKWDQLMRARRMFMNVKLSYDCRCLVQFVNDTELMFSELGFTSAEDMIRKGYGLEPDEIAIAVRWLELNPPAEPISLNKVRVLACREIGIKGGKAGPGRGHKTDDNVSRFKHGNSRAYILARLDRDGHVELAAKVRAKAISANAAAIAAGFRKKPTDKIAEYEDTIKFAFGLQMVFQEIKKHTDFFNEQDGFDFKRTVHSQLGKEIKRGLR